MEPTGDSLSTIPDDLDAWRQRDPEKAGKVIAAVYGELRLMSMRLLRSERTGHTLQPTALVHELYLRMSSSQPPEWRNRGHFFAVAARTLRHILIDYGRAQKSERRGGGHAARIELSEGIVGLTCSIEELLEVHDVLTQLERAEPRAAQVTELRFFAGLEEKEIAVLLGVSEITVKRDWKFARAWLANHLSGLEKRLEP